MGQAEDWTGIAIAGAIASLVAVIWALIHERRKAKAPVVDKPAPSNPKPVSQKTIRISVWMIGVFTVVVFALLAYKAMMPGGVTELRDKFGVAFLGAAGLVLLFTWSIWSNGRKLAKEPNHAYSATPRPVAKAGTGLGTWVSVILLTAFITWKITPSAPRGPAPAQPRAATGLGAFVVLFLSMVTSAYWVWFGVSWVRLRAKIRDVACERANERTKAGDLSGAITELESVINWERPTPMRLFTLASLYSLDGRNGDVLKTCDVGQPLDPMFDVAFKALRGVALERLGYPAEAEPLLATALPLSRDARFVHCHYCLALAKLGRTAEAAQQLAKIENMPDKDDDSSYARKRDQLLIEECRDAVALA